MKFVLEILQTPRISEGLSCIYVRTGRRNIYRRGFFVKRVLAPLLRSCYNSTA